MKRKTIQKLLQLGEITSREGAILVLVLLTTVFLPVSACLSYLCYEAQNEPSKILMLSLMIGDVFFLGWSFGFACNLIRYAFNLGTGEKCQTLSRDENAVYPAQGGGGEARQECQDGEGEGRKERQQLPRSSTKKKVKLVCLVTLCCAGLVGSWVFREVNYPASIIVGMIACLILLFIVRKESRTSGTGKTA